MAVFPKILEALTRHLKPRWRHGVKGSNAPAYYTALCEALGSENLFPELRDKIRVNTRFNGEGEYLCDVVAHTYPKSEQIIQDADSRKAACYEILVAVEFEEGWGGEKLHPRETPSEMAHRLVIDDFCKLCDLRARAKVMIYRGPDEDGLGLEGFRDTFLHILNRHNGFDPGEQWLFVGIPHEWERGWKPQVHVLAGNKPNLRLDVPVWWQGR